jgi:tetratricopeptide (TPR) repeat protein
MHLQIIPLDMTVADRWFYFTIVGLLGMIGVVIQNISSSFVKQHEKIFVGIAVCIFVLVALRTMVRNTNWSNNIVLFSHDATEIDNFQNENNLATFYSLKNQPQDALIHVKRSVAILPYDANLTNLGFIYENLRDYTHAEDAYKHVLSADHKSSSFDSKETFAYLHLGGLYLATGKPAEAENIYKKALRKYPTNGVLWAFLAASQYALHAQKDALQSALMAKKYYPNNSTNILYEKIRDKKEFDVKKL